MNMRLAVLGLGKAGLRHVRAAQAGEGMELVAAADSSAEARERAPAECRVVEHLDALIEIGADAVIIALPHALLADAALRAIESGLHVLVEKPMATTLDEGRRIVDAAKTAGLHLMVNYNHRFRDEYQTAKKWLEEGRIGRPCLISEQMFAPEGPLPAWVWEPKIAGGGMMTYNGSHMLDHVMWLSGAPVSAVSATTASLHYDEPLEDTTVASLRFTTGALASLVQSKSNVAHRQGGWETRVLGTEGALRIVSGEGVFVSGSGGEEHFASGPERRFAAALAEFASTIRENKRPSPDGTEALRVLSCLRALYRAAESGGWVEVE